MSEDKSKKVSAVFSARYVPALSRPRRERSSGCPVGDGDGAGRRRGIFAAEQHSADSTSYAGAPPQRRNRRGGPVIRKRQVENRLTCRTFKEVQDEWYKRSGQKLSLPRIQQIAGRAERKIAEGLRGLVA